jgi:hypothetical protein
MYKQTIKTTTNTNSCILEKAIKYEKESVLKSFITFGTDWLNDKGLEMGILMFKPRVIISYYYSKFCAIGFFF